MNISENVGKQNENNNNKDKSELNSNYEIPTNSSIPLINYYDSINKNEKPSEILFIKILNELNSNSSNNILNYLSIKELVVLSVVNRSIKAITENYFPIRLKIEYNDIKNFESKNIALKNLYLKKYSIPIPENNWFYSDIKKAIKTILNLSRQTISQIRGIRRLSNLEDEIYAPLCLIFNYNSKHEKVINCGWKKTADIIISDPRFFIQISNLKIENLDYKNIKQAFIKLNQIENYIDKIKRFSPYLYELNIWCKAVVIAYILVHPYKLKDKIKNELYEYNEEVYKFVIFMDEIINKFYIFKGFLEVKKIIRTTLGEYIFNFEYNKDNSKVNNLLNKEKVKLKVINDVKLMGNILSYLDINESFLFINFNKSLYYSFQQSLNINCYNILKKIFIIKYNTFNDFYSIIPSIFENNIFSQYFFMLEDVLYPNSLNISFLTKDNINYIKNYKGNNELINTICKIFCIIFNIKVEKAFDNDSYLVNLYIKSVILLCFKENSLNKLIRYFNIFNMNNTQIKAFYEEISKIYSIDKIKKVKNINKVFYQLLIWELFLFEYIKQLNPFLLLDKDTILNHNTNSLNENQINIINNYIENLENLKTILKVKYHFHNLFFNKRNNKKFIQIIKDVIEEMKGKKIYNDNINHIIENFNIKQKYISKAYFNCKRYFINKDIPSLYQKIMEQLILINFEMIKSPNQKSKLNKITKDENYYFNLFISTKNLKHINYLPNYGYCHNIKSSRINMKFNNKKSKYEMNININKLKYDTNSYVNTQKNKLSLSNDYFPEKFNKNKKYLSPDKLYISKIIYNNYLHISTIDEIKDDIFITKILFYLQISDLAKFSLTNKRFNKLIKTHLYIRLFFLEKKKNLIEKKYSRIIHIIEEKRKNFHRENNFQLPNLYNSSILLSSLGKKDINELRNLFKSYKLLYEIVISVLCILLNIEPFIFFDEFGQKIIDFFTPGKKLLYNNNIIKIIKNIDLDNINKKIYSKIEKIMQSEIFNYIDEYTYPSCLINLIKFEFGIIEYFRATRKYYTNSFEINNNILNEKEIHFCKKMDECLDAYYKIKNFTFNKCQKYQLNGIKLLKTIDLNQNFTGEIKDFIFDDDI